jgi:hypothetical protein
MSSNFIVIAAILAAFGVLPQRCFGLMFKRAD